mmetsp:Transcript_69841/g.160565  ORF Transcript_69841/g.160565 Transcript_69841/m.160565 type:complete len:226 (+) Transcript_69841:515-1192(+)
MGIARCWREIIGCSSSTRAGGSTTLCLIRRASRRRRGPCASRRRMCGGCRRKRRRGGSCVASPGFPLVLIGPFCGYNIWRPSPGPRHCPICEVHSWMLQQYRSGWVNNALFDPESQPPTEGVVRITPKDVRRVQAEAEKRRQLGSVRTSCSGVQWDPLCGSRAQYQENQPRSARLRGLCASRPRMWSGCRLRTRWGGSCPSRACPGVGRSGFVCFWRHCSLQACD